MAVCGGHLLILYIFAHYLIGIELMKKIIAILVFCAAGMACAQTAPAMTRSAPQEHRGFYSNMSFAFAYNWYDNSREDLHNKENGKMRDVDYYEFNGFTFPYSEFKFGVAFANLVAVHFDFNLGFFAGTMDYSFERFSSDCFVGVDCEERLDENRLVKPTSNNAYSFRSFFGFGTTVYPFRDRNSPMNGFFLGASVGYTLFITMINSDEEETTGNGGVGFGLEIGKEWWIDDHMSIGVGLGFSHSSLIWQTIESHSSDNVLSLSFRLTRG